MILIIMIANQAISPGFPHIYAVQVSDSSAGGTLTLIIMIANLAIVFFVLAGHAALPTYTGSHIPLGLLDRPSALNLERCCKTDMVRTYPSKIPVSNIPLKYPSKITV